MFRSFQVPAMVLVSMLGACQEDAEEHRYELPFTPSAYLKASNSSAGSYFGTSVAFSGDTLVVGAGLEHNAATGVDGDQDAGESHRSGAVYVFRREGAGWQQEAYIKASNTGEYDEFGTSVALSGDTIAVGAPYEASAARGIDGDQSDDNGSRVGAVYVFDRAGATWQQAAYVKASNARVDESRIPDGDFFGYSVSLSDDLLAVGAFGEDSAATGVNGDQGDTSAPGSGAVYVFRRAGSSWAQQAYIKASETLYSGGFGSSVALAGDRLAVGAFYAGDQSGGAAYVFRRAGSSWVEEAVFEDPGLVRDSRFGYGLALSDDTLVIGAIGAYGTTGAVYVYRRAGTDWDEEARIEPSEPDVSAFGLSVALSGDTLAVGAIGGDAERGAVFVYQRTGTAWQQVDLLRAPGSAPPDYFGAGVALSGGTLVVGASGEDSAAQGIDGDQADTSAPFSGAVFVYE